MTHYTLADLGWSASFDVQPRALSEYPARVASVARDRLLVLSPQGEHLLVPPSDQSTGDFAVGDWLLMDDSHQRALRRIMPQTELSRRAAGTDARRQLIAANVDTLGIVTSCNADFNIPRLERYLALASSAGCLPLVILTKADECDDPRRYVTQAERLSPLVTAAAIDATDPYEAKLVAPWCRDGQTLALVGSSGVGKSTLTNALTGQQIATQGIREDDAKGRHTTTARGLHRTTAGGWLIDTPGMRALRLTDARDGIDAVFSDLDQLAAQCRFSDCGHDSEPGCAIRAAIDAGAVTADRLERWRKLQREDARNTASVHEQRAQDRDFAKMVRRVMQDKKRNR